MKLAIMQPYIFPYIGYFQLINAVDEFVIYDNIEYTKKGWINRNRILVNGSDSFITVPLKHDSDYLDIKDRYLADSWPDERKKILSRIKGAYNKAPFFNSAFQLVEECFMNEELNLFSFIFNSIIKVKEYLNIPTAFSISSGIDIDHELKAEKKVMEICKAKNADTYINPIGGVGLYDKSMFKNGLIDLYFLKSNEIKYKQPANDFIPWLSIIDVIMWNSIEQVRNYLNEYELI